MFLPIRITVLARLYKTEDKTVVKIRPKRLAVIAILTPLIIGLTSNEFALSTEFIPKRPIIIPIIVAASPTYRGECKD
jgi:hypothetical protein